VSHSPSAPQRSRQHRRGRTSTTAKRKHRDSMAGANQTRSASGSRPTTPSATFRPAKRSWRRPRAPARRCPDAFPLPTKERLLRDPLAVQGQGLARHFEIRTHKPPGGGGGGGGGIDLHQPTPKTVRLLQAGPPPGGFDIGSVSTLASSPSSAFNVRHPSPRSSHDPGLPRDGPRRALTVLEAGPCPVTAISRSSGDG